MNIIRLPLFPLGLVAFPDEELNLHIFESRYRQLIHECSEEGKTFGIPTFVEGEPLTVGTEMRLLEISKVYSDGKMDVKTLGLSVFKIHDYYSQEMGKLYPSGDVELVAEDTSIGSEALGVKLLERVKQLYKIANAPDKTIEWSPDFRLTEIVHKIGLSINQELSLLMLPSEDDRLKYAIYHLDKMIATLLETEVMKKRIQMNGHFKHIQPPDLG